MVLILLRVPQLSGGDQAFSDLDTFKASKLNTQHNLRSMAAITNQQTHKTFEYTLFLDSTASRCGLSGLLWLS
jgi:hypothetical protein